MKPAGKAQKVLAEIVRIETPHRYILNGIWLGPAKAKRIFIFVHGLGANLFSMHRFLEELIEDRTAVLTFNNRGHDTVSAVRRKISKNKSSKKMAGAAYEIFTESADDIGGAISFARKRGVKEIYLLGHSTGAQKTAYYLAKTGDKRVKGAVLLAPLSDYAVSRREPLARRNKFLALARRTAKRNPHALLPLGILPVLMDAQRFLSLYAGEGPEEVFPYWDKKQKPVALRRVRTPVFVALGSKDEYSDRPVKEIADWFVVNSKDGDAVAVISGANHGFYKKEAKLAEELRRWLALK